MFPLVRSWEHQGTKHTRDVHIFHGEVIGRTGETPPPPTPQEHSIFFIALVKSCGISRLKKQHTVEPQSTSSQPWQENANQHMC